MTGDRNCSYRTLCKVAINQTTKLWLAIGLAKEEKMKKLKLSTGSNIDVGVDFLILQRTQHSYRKFYFLGAKLYHTSLASLKLINAQLSSLYGFYDNESYFSLEDDMNIKREGWKIKISSLKDGFEKCHMSFIASNTLKSVLFGENEEDYEEGLFEYLMRKFDLPMKKEWMQYLKDEYIRPDTTVSGLKEARERLEYLRMSPEEQHEYDYYLDTLVRDTDVMKTKILEAEIKARKQGMAEGLAEGHAEDARKMKKKGYAIEDIMDITGLSAEEIAAL